MFKFYKSKSANTLTHTSNVNKVLAREHQVVHSGVVGEISVLKILFCKH